MTAIKGTLGENFASGGVRTAALALAMHGGMVPPTLGLTSSILSLDVVKSVARKMDVNCGLVNACASSGTRIPLCPWIAANFFQNLRRPDRLSFEKSPISALPRIPRHFLRSTVSTPHSLRIRKP